MLSLKRVAVRMNLSFRTAMLITHFEALRRRISRHLFSKTRTCALVYQRARLLHITLWQEFIFKRIGSGACPLRGGRAPDACTPVKCGFGVVPQQAPATYDLPRQTRWPCFYAVSKSFNSQT